MGARRVPAGPHMGSLRVLFQWVCYGMPTKPHGSPLGSYDGSPVGSCKVLLGSQRHPVSFCWDPRGAPWEP
eukprot:2598330-Pyramimonas_sp.AAC.1